MYLKVKHFTLFVAVLTMSYFTLYCIGETPTVQAQEKKAEQVTACPLDKSDKSSCSSTSRCAHQYCCCEQSKECYHKSHCSCKRAGSHHCKVHCEHKQDGHHYLTNMIGLARCAKKELLKEKMKANLEKKVGDKLDKVADLLVDAMLEEYKAGVENKKRYEELRENIGKIFSEKKSQ